MRSSILSDLEIAAFTKFTTDYDILIDGEVGVKNADILCTAIINSDAEITAQTLAASFLRVKAQLQLKSPTYKKADELASKLSPEEQAIYKAWAGRQKLLIGLDGSPEAYQNVATLLGWFRGNPVTSHNLDLALGNVVNNAKFGRIHFKPQPKQDRAYGPGGLLNHAKNQEEPKAKTSGSQEFHPNGRRNHSYVPPQDAAKSTPVSVEYQAKAESLQGRTHGQTDQARKLFVMVPGTTTIDWQQTHAARERFLNTQVALIRR